jgi:hypothetical protein
MTTAHFYDHDLGTNESFQAKVPYPVAVQSTKAHSEHTLSFLTSRAHAERNNQVQIQLAVKINMVY